MNRRRSATRYEWKGIEEKRESLEGMKTFVYYNILELEREDA